LKETQALRLLEPKHIDQLVATSGMVIRVSAILPDMQSAWFKCTKCQHEVDVSVENGRIDEPSSLIKTSCNIVLCLCFFFFSTLSKPNMSSKTSVLFFSFFIINIKKNEQIFVEAKDSYQLIYYRSYFADRQLLKVQESPESIPEVSFFFF
jgi:DNA replicative helicase MCM subunit Mcm2 (Cdc46/Mcm family)